MRRRQFSLLVLFILVQTLGCTEPRVKKHRDVLEPMVGKASRADVDKKLGSPTGCETIRGLERCEYRTAVQQNAPVPDTFRRPKGFGPDLSPYEYFDVLHLYFDQFGVLQDWKPIVIDEEK